MREDNGLTHKNQQVFIIMNPIDLNLEPPILAVIRKEYFYITKQFLTSMFQKNFTATFLHFSFKIHNVVFHKHI